jgi:hypothetical protein
MRDLKSKVNSTLVFGPAVLAADQTAVDIDLQGYNSAVISIAVGVGGITFDASNKIEFTLSDSDDDSTYTEVTSGDVDGGTTVSSGGIVKSLVAAHAAASLTKIGYVGGKRYLRLDIEFTGTHGTGTPIAVLVDRGNARLNPVV